LIYHINPKDERLRHISRDDYDCFVFDVFTINTLERLVKGETVNIEELITTLVDGGKSYNEYLVKARSIRSIVANNPYSSSYLVYQTLTDRRSRDKRPFLMIPIVLIDKGVRIERNGDLFVNPVVMEQLKTLSTQSIIPSNIKDIRSVDSPEIQTALETLEYRVSFELVLTHFKIQYQDIKGVQKPVFQTVKPTSLKQPQPFLSLPNSERTQIVQHVLDGKNLYLKSSYSYAMDLDVVDMLTQLAYQKKQVLYLSQYDSSLVRDALVQSGLHLAVQHLVEPMEDSVIPVEVAFNPQQLKDVEQQLLAYQNHMRHEENGIAYHQVLRQLIKLSNRQLQEVPIDSFETLSSNDYNAISRLLDESEALIKKLGIQNPSDCHWNAISIRDVRNREKEFHLQLGSFLAILNDTKNILQDLERNHGFVLPKSLPALREDLEYTGFLNTAKYPNTWLEDGVFSSVELSLQDQSDYMVRLNALVHTLTGNYKKEALDKQLPELYASMQDPMFASSEQAIDDLIARRQEILSKLSTLKRVWLDIQGSIQEFEVVYRTQANTGFLEFVTLNNKLLLDPTFDRQWLTVDPDKLVLLQQQMNYRQGLIDYYIQHLQALGKWMSPNILQLDAQTIKNYQSRLGKRFGIKPEQKSAEKLIEPHLTSAFQSLPTKSKQEQLDLALSLQQTESELQDIINLLQTTIKSKVKLSTIQEYQSIISMVLSNREHYTLQTLDQYRLNKVKILDTSFQSNMTTLRSLLKDPVFKSLYDETPSVVSERIKEVERFITNFNKSFDVFMSMQLQAGKKPSSTTMQGVVSIIERIRKTNKAIDAMEPQMKHQYQAMYMRERTDFSQIKHLKQEFAVMMNHFVSFDAMKQEANRDNFVFIKDQLRVLVTNLKNYDKQLPGLYTNYVSNEFSPDLLELIGYLTPFYRQEELHQWIALSDHLQSLRGFKQSRMAAQINTGVFTRGLKRSFQFEYLKKLLLRFDAPTEPAATKEAYATYREYLKQATAQHRYQLHTKLKKPRITISNLQTLPLLEKRKFDVVIVDGIERLPDTLLPRLVQFANQQVYIEDAKAPAVLGMINKPRQGIYPPINEVTWKTFQLRANHHVANFDSAGVIRPHSVTKHQSLALAETVVRQLLSTQGYITVVMFRQEQRNQVVESIQTHLLQVDAQQAVSLLKRVRVVVDPEYVLPSEAVYLLWDRYVMVDKLERYLPMSKELVIVNEDGSLDNADIERYIQPDIHYYPELKDEILVWLVSQLPQEFTYRQAKKPYDIAVSKDGNIDLLIHVMINDSEQLHILDAAVLLGDEQYTVVKTLMVGLHELYPITEVEHIAMKVRELLT
jgi:hypothetical protein